MKEFCIINYASGAAIYGIGTHIKEYIHCLENMSCRVNRIELGTDKNHADFYINEDGTVRTIHIPYTQNGTIEKYNKSICRLLRLYIEDSCNLIFHFHYLHSDSLLDQIKKYFPLSKSVLTIHYLYWSQSLQGDITLFEKIIRKQESKKIKEKFQSVIDNYKKEKSFMEKLDHIVCLSNDTLNLVQNQYQIKRNLWLIPNGFRKQYRNLSDKQKLNLREKYYIHPDEKILLFVGRINSIKGIYYVLPCFDSVLRNYPNCRLVVIGDGDVSQALKKCGNAWSKVVFTGRLDKKTVHQWYQVADIALFPSFYEECSYVGIEMMMHALPVVASDGYSVKNMFHDGLNARVAKIGDRKKPKEFENNLATVVLELLFSETLCKQLSNGSRKAYESCYTSKKMQEGYKKLIESLS